MLSVAALGKSRRYFVGKQIVRFFVVLRDFGRSPEVAFTQAYGSLMPQSGSRVDPSRKTSAQDFGRRLPLAKQILRLAGAQDFASELPLGWRLGSRPQNGSI